MVTQTVSRVTLNPRFTFDAFIAGPSNQFARSTALAVAESPGKTKFNPLLIYSGVGLGKTHLLQAIGNRIIAAAPHTSVAYFTAEEFYLEFIESIKANATKKFSRLHRAADVFLMDDIHFLSGKESTQEEFFHIFNTLYQNKKQIVLTADTPPSLLKGVQDRLLSRFQWGLSVDIQPPDLETRVAILKWKAQEDHLDLASEILYFIAEHVSSNIRELEGIVIRLLAFASITKNDITLDLVRDVLAHYLKKSAPKVSLDTIIETVAGYYKVPLDNLREKNRRKEVALCRQVAMYIAKSMTSHSLKSIGLYFGGRDHSTVIHAINAIERLRTVDAGLDKDITGLVTMLKTNNG